MIQTAHTIRALDHKVLVVAVAQYKNKTLRDWTAYVGAVEGVNHEREYNSVVETGTKIKKEWAFELFNHLSKDKWRA